MPSNNRTIRNIALFQSLVIFLLMAGLLWLADWRITVAAYTTAICYLPFFAKR